jgi:hypothetical protein
VTSYIPSALRQQVRERADDCCEYCRIPQSLKPFTFHIEHIIAEKHGGSTTVDNLGLSCRECNSHKGSDLTSIDPATGSVERLFHPREHVWDEHFRLDGSRIIGRSAAGRVTVQLLQLNAPQRLVERDAMIALDRYPCKPAVS